MRTVDDFARIRQLHREGLGIRRIAAQLGVGRDTVRKALANPEPKAYTLSGPRPAPVFGPFRGAVDAILAADETAPRKQRHTAQQIYRRLVAEHGYTGSYDPIRRHLKRRRLDRRETFIPLDHRPGVRAEADFGHIHVDLPTGRQLVPVLIVTWSYSNAPFAIALPTERTEAILHGLVEAFAFFGCVPAELWWDNPTTVAVHVLRGRERTLHPRYAALASHYPFTPKFCRPATPTEKPRVENRVYDLQRQWATPVPRVGDLAELNAHLRRCCVAARDRTCGDNTATVGERFGHDRSASLAVPDRPFDACVFHPAQVDKYQTVRFATAAGLVTALEEAQQQHRLDRLLAQFDRLDLLIVDELGYLSFSRAGAELLFQVFADRYERRSLLITSNLPFGEWGQVFQGERMTAALLDRLTHKCHLFDMNGESYRFRESMKAKKEDAPKRGK